MLTIDIYHDTVCPWCRIGKAHLQQALHGWDGPPVQINYHTFYLNPAIPPEGADFRATMLAKGGGAVDLEQFFAAPREAGARAGLVFNFEAISRAPNSTLSHQLINLTPAEEREGMIDAVYAAYFENGRDIGDLETLLDIAAAQGLDREQTRAQLAAGAGLETVHDDLAFARQNGISGVPFFVINNQYAFSGAQPPAMMRRVLEQVVAEGG
jgi:predicted DsbA family dithiol-disulfide isomerase